MVGTFLKSDTNQVSFCRKGILGFDSGYPLSPGAQGSAASEPIKVTPLP